MGGAAIGGGGKAGAVPPGPPHHWLLSPSAKVMWGQEGMLTRRPLLSPGSNAVFKKLMAVSCSAQFCSNSDYSLKNVFL